MVYFWTYAHSLYCPLPTKYAHPTYEICPSDLRNMPIQPTKYAHPTYEICPSDQQKVTSKSTLS